jgi:hypothetical protein
VFLIRSMRGVYLVLSEDTTLLVEICLKIHLLESLDDPSDRTK